MVWGEHDLFEIIQELYDAEIKTRIQIQTLSEIRDFLPNMVEDAERLANKYFQRKKIETKLHEIIDEVPFQIFCFPTQFLW